MALDPKTVRKPFRKMRKLLKRFSDPPDPEEVHDARTHTRQIEALVGVFGCVDRKSGKKVMKTLKPIRKAAGDVRDMDVLTNLTASLDAGDDEECRLKLMLGIADRRTRAAAKLNKKVKANAQGARDVLKRTGKRAVHGLAQTNTREGKSKARQKSHEKSANTMASALRIEQELRDWPTLTKKNLHPFRLKVKELRYILQSSEPNDSSLVDTLGKVKDEIGLWHDWSELSLIASEVLDHKSNCAIQTQIRTRMEQELDKAITAANRLRTRYLQVERERSSGRKPPVVELHPVAITAASRLAS